MVRVLAPSEQRFVRHGTYTGRSVSVTGELDAAALKEAFAALQLAFPVVLCRIGEDESGTGYLLRPADSPIGASVTEGDVETVGLPGVPADPGTQLAYLDAVVSGASRWRITLFVHHSIADAGHCVELLSRFWGFYTDIVESSPITAVPQDYPQSLEWHVAQRGITAGRVSGFEAVIQPLPTPLAPVGDPTASSGSEWSTGRELAAPGGEAAPGPGGEQAAGPEVDAPIGEQAAGLGGEQAARAVGEWSAGPEMAGPGAKRAARPGDERAAGPSGERAAGPSGERVVGPGGDRAVGPEMDALGGGQAVGPGGGQGAGPVGEWSAGLEMAGPGGNGVAGSGGGRAAGPEAVGLVGGRAAGRSGDRAVGPDGDRAPSSLARPRRIRLDEAATARIVALGHHRGVSVNGLITAALLRAYASETGSATGNPVRLGCLYPVDMRSRLDPRVAPAAGTNMAGLASFAAEVDPSGSVLELAQHISARLRADLASGVVQQSVLHFPDFYGPTRIHSLAGHVAITNTGAVPRFRTPAGLTFTDYEIVYLSAHPRPSTGASAAITFLVYTFHDQLTVGLLGGACDQDRVLAAVRKELTALSAEVIDG